MEIIIKVLNKESPPDKKTSKEAKPSLEERVVHAIDCIDCDVNKAQAIKFLQKVLVYLDGQPKHTKKLQVLMEKVQNALSPYGILPLPNKENKE